MKIILVIFISFFFLFSCNRSQKSEKKLLVGHPKFVRVEKQIVVLEDTLKVFYKQLINNKVDTLPIRTIHILERNYKRAFQLGKTQENSSIYLDKLQQLYTQEKKYALSLDWTDTLLLYFPHYKQKAALLLNAATTAEVFLKDRKKMTYYYNRLLNEHPKLKKEIVEMVKLRLGKS